MSSANRWRATLVLFLTCVVGVAAFLWPFVLSSPEAIAQGQDLPWLFTVLMALLAMLVLAELSASGLSAHNVAVLGALAAIGGALRVLSAGTAGLEPIFALLVLGGRVLGARLGFLMGSMALLTGAFLTGGVGPWTPFQMIGCGWVAMGAGLLPRVSGRREVVMLVGYGVLASMAYGALLNLWFWPFAGATSPAGAGFVTGDGAMANLVRYALFYVVTSLGWDLSRGLFTAVLVAFGGRRVLASLRRATRRASFAALPATATAATAAAATDEPASQVTSPAVGAT